MNNILADKTKENNKYIKSIFMEQEDEVKIYAEIIRRKATPFLPTRGGTWTYPGRLVDDHELVGDTHTDTDIDTHAHKHTHKHAHTQNYTYTYINSSKNGTRCPLTYTPNMTSVFIA